MCNLLVVHLSIIIFLFLCSFMSLTIMLRMMSKNVYVYWCRMFTFDFLIRKERLLVSEIIHGGGGWRNSNLEDKRP